MQNEKKKLTYQDTQLDIPNSLGDPLSPVNFEL